MAIPKTISVSTAHEYESKGQSESVADALSWLAKNGYEYEPGDLIVYAVRRLRALHKDDKRYRAGKLARRLYAPRVENVERAPRKLAALVSTVHEVGEKLAPPERKP